jgi:ATP-binding cassette, subfamily B, heavy metal transporter
MERGNHAALLAQQGRYASMWSMQQNAEASHSSVATSSAT